MILSRIVFNPMNAAVYRFVGDPYGLHIRLCQCFAASRAEAGILYRIEEGPVLLVQSELEADWSKLGLPDSALRGLPASKTFEPEFLLGQRLSFRLRCRPSVKKAEEGHKHSKQRYLRTDEERRQWLARQGERWGFRVEQVEVSQERWHDTKPGQPAPPAGKDGKRVDTFPATRFDGVLVVTDPDKIREAVRKGIGPQKAYGFGLLSLARFQA